MPLFPKRNVGGLLRGEKEYLNAVFFFFFFLKEHSLFDESTKHKQLKYSEILQSTNLQEPNLNIVLENGMQLKYKTVMDAAFMEYIAEGK